MRLKRIMAMFLCFAMVLSTMGTTVFAENTAVVSAEATAVSDNNLYVNTDYNSETEGYGVTRFANYNAAYAYAVANNTSATIVVEKNNSISGFCFDNNHKNYTKLAVVIKDGATMGVSLSKWDMTYPVTVEAGGTLTCARPKNASVSNIHIKNKLIIGTEGSDKQAYCYFLSDSYQDCDISIRYNGSITAYNAVMTVQDLDAQGSFTATDSNITVDGAFASATWYATTLTDSDMQINGNQISGGLSDFSGGDNNQLGKVTLNGDSSISFAEGSAVDVAATVTVNGNSYITADTLTVEKNKKINVNGTSSVSAQTLTNNGTIATTSGSTVTAKTVSEESTGTVTIDGEEAAFDESGNLVLPAAPVATVDGVPYTELQAALDAAAAGEGNVTVEILENINLTNVDWNPVTVSAPKYPVVTVNGNGKIITGLNDMLFAGTWAGGSGLIINDLTIADSAIINDKDDTNGNVGVGAFIGFPQASATVTLNNCHLVDSRVEGGHWTGGLIGYAAGYAGNDGPVFMNLTINECSVTGSTITGKGSAGGIIGHATGNAWTQVTITDTTVSGNTVASTGSSTNKAGAVIGTIGAAGQATTVNGVEKTGGVSVAATVSGNTVTSSSTTITTIYGRQGTDTGMLYVSGGEYDNYPIEENVAYAAPIEGYEIADNGNGTWGIAEETILSGAGTQEDPYLIEDIDDLTLFRDNVNNGTDYDGQYVKLMSDIDLTSVENWIPIGAYGSHANEMTFRGYFDGNNKTISNLTVNDTTSTADILGLFGHIHGDGMKNTLEPSVKNLTLTNVNISSTDSASRIGGLAGNPYTCYLENVHVSGTISGGKWTGGIAGNCYTVFENCSFTGTVDSNNQAGGIAGAGDARVYNSKVIGDITATYWAGGIIGNGQEGASAVGCYAKGTVTAESNWYFGVGGIAGVGGHGYEGSVYEDNYFDGEVYLGETKVNAIVVGFVNADGNEAMNTVVDGNSWNTEYYAADTPVVVTADVTSDISPEDWAASASEEKSSVRNNNLVMLESDIQYVDATSMDNVTIMKFSEVTEEEVEVQIEKNNLVAKIGETGFASLAEAIVAANAMTGDVTVEIYAKVEYNDATASLTGAYDSINFVGKTEDAEISITRNGSNGYISGEGNDCKVTFTDLILSKPEGHYANDAGFMNMAFSVYRVASVKYTNCQFPNGACAAGCPTTYTNCTFEKSHEKYALWAYGTEVVVDECTFDDDRGIKMYAEGSAKTTELTVTNTDFSKLTSKPAIVATLGQSITLSGNTYSAKGVLELEDNGSSNGIEITSEDVVTCISDAYPDGCGVLVDGAIYRTVAEAAEVAEEGSTVTLLHNSTETVELSEGVTLDKNGFTADGVTVKVSVAAKIGETYYETVQAAINAAQSGDTVEILPGEYDPINISSKNITIQGTVGDNGELLTTIKGGNPAITGHSFNGTIKDLKIVDAWKVMYAEPAGNITVDNVYVTGATYGFHLVAYSEGLTWTIQNSYMDLRWANSLGVYKDGDAEIIIKGNEFVSTDPYYSDYGALHVNSFLPNVTVEENIFRENAKIYIDASVTDTSNINISKNYHADGVENAFADDTDGVTVKIDSYYTVIEEDGTLSGLVEVVDPAAKIGDTTYETLAAAIAAVKEGETITMLADTTVSENVTLPAGITFNGNGKKISRENGAIIYAGGELTFEGYTTIANFNANGKTINIGEGATLETTDGRMVIGHGATFNITGSIADAKTADVTNITPSLIAPGVSFTGAGVNFNVTNAYVKFTAYCSSKNSNASGTYNINVNNSIWEQTGSLVFSEPTNGMDPTFNFKVKDSVLNSTSHLVFAVTKGEIVFDNSVVNEGVHRQLENRSNLTIKNGSVVYAAHATSSNAKNPGTTIVENATYIATGDFSGSDVGTGTLIVKKGAIVNMGKITKANIVVDATDMAAGDVVGITANLSALEGTISVVNNNLDAEIVDGAIVLVEKPVAQIGDEKFASLEEAFKAATDGCTITLMSDITVSELWDCRYNGAKFTVPVTIDGNNKTLKLTGAVDDKNWNTVFRFEADATVKNLTIDASEATGIQRGISAKSSITVENCTFIGNGTSTKRGVIFGEGAGTALSDVVATITNSKFTNWSYGVSDNQSGKDAKSVSVTGSTFINASALLSASDSVTFTGNTVSDGYVNITSYTAADTATVVATGNNLVGTDDEITVNPENITSDDSFITPVAKIGSKYYETLDKAISKAAVGDTVVLLTDVELSDTITIPTDKKITLDLSSKTITGTDNTEKNFSLIDNRGDLTITGNGTMTLTATVNSGWNRYSAVLANNPGGKLTIENGTFEHLGGTDMAYGIDNLTNGKGTYAETIINGGTIKSTYRGIRQFLNGIEAQNILTVNGGTVEGTNKSIWMQDPNKNANTGTLTVTDGATLNGDVYLTVTEGSTEWPVEVSIAKSAVNGQVLTNGNEPAGYELVEENGTYGVIEKEIVTPFKDAPLFLAGLPDEVIDGVTYHPVYMATSIDSLNYRKVGFDYTFSIFDTETGEVTFSVPYTTETSEVYSSISDANTTYTVDSIGGNGEYLFMNKLLFHAEHYHNNNTKVTITPYAIDTNGNKITGWTIDMTNEFYKSLQSGDVKQDMFKEGN